MAGCEADDTRPPVWEYISPVIVQPSCATVSCHSPAAAAAGLDLSAPDRGYRSLTALPVWIVDAKGAGPGCMEAAMTTVCASPSRPMVTPYNPAQSRLIAMLRAQSASRMPPDRPLPEADVRLIERWIANGARRFVDDPPPPLPTPRRLDLDAGSASDAGDAAADGK